MTDEGGADRQRDDVTLRTLLEAAGAPAGDEASEPVRAEVSGDGASTWAIHGVVFATLDPAGTMAAFRLDAVLASAARRTPDTAASFLGPDWVEFRPAILDGHAADRTTAWFLAAARRAVG